MARDSQKYHAKLFTGLSELLTNKKFIQANCVEETHFTRKKTLTFQTVTLLILQLLKSSVKTELKSFYTTVFRVDEVVNWISDSAFCKARQKIRHRLFIDLYKFIVRFFYAKAGWLRWFHFRLLAVDGSALNLPSSGELLNKFGCHHTNSIETKIPQARVSFLSDVLNYITLDAQIESFKVSEQHMFNSHLDCVGKGDLLTADANYGHFWILKKVSKTKAAFCFRVNKSSSFVQEFLKSGQKDIVCTWNPSPKTIESCKRNKVDITPLEVRLVRIDLSENETEVLVLSLLDQLKYNYDCIKDLYDKRWTVEEEIKKLMQRQLIEFFSSLKVNGVLQDFYANIFMLNLVSFLAEPTREQIYKASEHCKYRQQINWTSALSDIRNRVVLLFLRGLDKVESIIKSVRDSIMIDVEAIKPGRKFPRDKRKKGSRRKCFINYKLP